MAPEAEEPRAAGEFFPPGEIERHNEAFVEKYSQSRYHENLDKVTPADADFGKAPAIIKQREGIERKAIEYRRLQYRKLAA